MYSEGQQMGIELIERFAFYERSKQAVAVVATGEGWKYHFEKGSFTT